MLGFCMMPGWWCWLGCLCVLGAAAYGCACVCALRVRVTGFSFYKPPHVCLCAACAVLNAGFCMIDDYVGMLCSQARYRHARLFVSAVSELPWICLP
jgi:hypothetical protein